MKSSLLIVFSSVLILSACNPEKKSSRKEKNTDLVQRSIIGTSCYSRTFEKDLNAFELIVQPDSSAFGYIVWEPFEKDGARGWFEGKQTDSLLSGDFTYMIEGSLQTEEIVFKVVKEGLLKGEGALDVNGDRLRILDKSTLVFEDLYKRTDCAQITESIERARGVYKRIKNERAKRYESLTGTYGYDLGGDRGAGDLRVKQLDSKRVQVEFTITMHGPAFNSGSGAGILELDENLSGEYFTDEFGAACRILFQFKGNKVITKMLEGDAADCGFGHNVFADQEFGKVDSADPFSAESSKK